MCKRFSDIDGVQVMMDDLRIYESTKQEHDRLQKVLFRTKEINLKFNLEKSHICQDKATYLGHIFSKDSVQVNKNKVNAICDIPPPTIVTELQRFLGMINYIGSYIPNLSQKTSNLRTLLSKDTTWIWNDLHVKEFDNLKDMISPILSNYDPNKDIHCQ